MMFLRSLKKLNVQCTRPFVLTYFELQAFTAVN